MKIEDKKSFINTFLSPISRLSESTVINFTKDKVNSLVASSDGTILLYASTPQVNDSIFKLNIPDINRLIKVLSCISEDNIDLDVDTNSIGYRSINSGFKYHLLEDGIISTPTVNLEKLNNLEFDLKFEIDTNTLNALLKASAFTTDSDKIYFYTNSDGVYGQLTDNERHNIDVYTQRICESYTGTSITTPTPVNFEIIRIISGIRFDFLKVSVNTSMNVFVFDLEKDNYTLKFIVSAYVS